MAGLANLLRQKSSIVQGDQDGPQHIQLPEEILLDLPVAKYGLGGDVEGGADQGVGGMSNDGNQSNGTESDGGGSWGGPSDYSGGWDSGSISESMGNWGESNGYGSDFSGPGPGGENMGGTSFGGSSFDGWGDGGFGANISGTNGGFGMGWSGDNIDYEGIADQMGNFGEAAGYGRDFDGPGPGGGNDIYGGYQDNEFGAGTAFGSLGGLAGAFGAYTPDGALTGPQASDVSFAGTSGIGTAPLQGSLDDYAPGPMQTFDPVEMALTAVAANATPATPNFDDVELSFDNEEDDPLEAPVAAIPGQFTPNGIQHPSQRLVDGLFDIDLRSRNSLISPERRAGIAVGLTERLADIAKGKTLAADEMGVLASRAAYGHNVRDYARDPITGKRVAVDENTLYGQAIAPSQFSGIKVNDRINNAHLNQAYAFAEKNPDKLNAVASTLEGILQGTAVPATMGATAFSRDGRAARVSGNDKSMGFVGDHAFGNYNPGAVSAYNDKVGRNQVSPDDNPAFNTPARGLGPQSWSVDIDPAEVDLADATPGFTGPVRDSMSLAGLPSNPTGRDWGFSDMLGIGSAMAKPIEDRVPDLPNQAAYEGMPVSVDTLAAERAAMGPVNGVPVGKEEKPGGWGWSDIASMIGTGFGNLFSTEQPAIAYDEPGPVDRYDQQKGFTPANTSVLAELESTFPSLTPEAAMGQFSARDYGSMPGTKSGLVGQGPTFGGRGPGLPGYESMGLPSGRPGSRMDIDPRIDTNRREGPIETDAPRAGALVAGSGVPTDYGTAPGKKSGSTGTKSTSTGTKSARGTATADVYGPVMPGMIPGTDRYPTSGVIAQPNTWAHEKIAEPLGGALAGMALGAVHPGLSLANTVSGLFGGPSTRGLFGDSSPGMDLSRGQDHVGGEHGDRPRTSDVPTKDTKPPKKEEDEPERWVPPQYEDYASLFARRYLGPDDDPTSYGRKGRSERQYFTAAQGGAVKPRKGSAALSQPGLSMSRAKRTT